MSARLPLICGYLYLHPVDERVRPGQRWQHQYLVTELTCTRDRGHEGPHGQPERTSNEPGADLDVAPDAPTEVRGQAWGQAGQP